MVYKTHCEKRRNCLFQAISPFSTMFSTAICLECIKMHYCDNGFCFPSIVCRSEDKSMSSSHDKMHQRCLHGPHLPGARLEPLNDNIFTLIQIERICR